MSWELLLPILGLGLVAAFSAVISPSPADLYIAPNGDDAHPGTLEKPFATLERSRDEIRRLKQRRRFAGATVHLRGGRYELDQTFTLAAEDSGTPEAPIMYRAFADEEVVLSGGRTLSAFDSVEDPAILDRLSPEARPHVRQADLAEAGITDFGTVATAGDRLELFLGDRAMTLARWPDEDFVRVDSVFAVDPFKVHGIDGDRVGKFTYTEDRPARWVDEPDAWLHGYWFWDWSDQPQKVKSIDPENRVIELEEPYHGYGYRPGQRFYAFNLLCELDRPGEWYLDRDNSRLYVWPPADLESARAVVSILPTLISCADASYLTFRGLRLEATRGTLRQRPPDRVQRDLRRLLRNRRRGRLLHGPRLDRPRHDHPSQLLSPHPGAGSARRHGRVPGRRRLGNPDRRQPVLPRQPRRLHRRGPR